VVPRPPRAPCHRSTPRIPRFSRERRTPDDDWTRCVRRIRAGSVQPVTQHARHRSNAATQRHAARCHSGASPQTSVNACSQRSRAAPCTLPSRRAAARRWAAPHTPPTYARSSSARSDSRAVRLATQQPARGAHLARTTSQHTATSTRDEASTRRMASGPRAFSHQALRCDGACARLSRTAPRSEGRAARSRCDDGHGPHVSSAATPATRIRSTRSLATRDRSHGRPVKRTVSSPSVAARYDGHGRAARSAARLRRAKRGDA
jgi:hypothetical protein